MSKAGVRPMPADFVEMRMKLGSTGRLIKHYKAGSRAIRRWLDEAGLPNIKNVPPSRKKPIPDDFPVRAAVTPKQELIRFYGVSTEVISRWLSEAGVTCPRAKPRIGLGNQFPKRVWDTPTAKTATPYDMAVNYLRRFTPVNSCNEDGSWALDGDYFRVGRNIMSKDALLDHVAAHKARRGGAE